MNLRLRRAFRRGAKAALEAALPLAERLTGFRTARGDYLPNRLRILLGIYEADELRQMKTFLHAGQVIVDVGANVGYLTRFFARATSVNGKVFAFEPNPLIFPLLEKNVARYRQVSTYNLGLSKTEQELPLFLAGSDYSVASFSRKYPLKHVVHQASGQLNSVAAKLVAGDDFMRKIDIDRIDILKVDVEGWEVDVLEGLEKTIMSSKEITIFCELNPAAQECAGRAPNEPLDWLLDRQFTLSYPFEGEVRPLSRDSIAEVGQNLGPKGYTTLFAQRN